MDDRRTATFSTNTSVLSLDGRDADRRYKKLIGPCYCWKWEKIRLRWSRSTWAMSSSRAWDIPVADEYIRTPEL